MDVRWHEASKITIILTNIYNFSPQQHMYFQFGPFIYRGVFVLPEYQVVRKSNQQASSYEQNGSAYNNYGFSVT